ncbi:MAG TPA: glucodextranase DOMON-like domain-containing protein [Steroidobacteraceae bacterium]|nr:glucodextranase DOMON-like domain-containing protein [Steroidobacteraceae bacterium]
MKFSCLPGLVAAALLLVTRAAGAEVLFSIEDPKGDDDGSGALLYPNRDDLEPGDLDLVRFSAEERDDGVWFVVEMAQPIRSPVGRVTQIGQTAIDRIARNGFYTFNVDIYIDTDRTSGAGETGAVPGRGVTIDRDFAWEKAIVLTPRPDTARTMLQIYYDQEYEAELKANKGRTSKEDLAAVEGRSEQHVSDRYFFPTKVRVATRRIEFQVPPEFLGDVPSKAWGYTVIVTGCDIEETGRPGLFSPSRQTMMTMPVARGLQSSQWGIRGDVDEATPPVVDILETDQDAQAKVLDDYDMVAGRLAAVPGVAPDGNVAVAASGKPLTTDQAARMDQASRSGGAAAGTPPAAERRTVPARLRTLNQLLEDGLITQAEYNELRRKILAEL